MSHQNEFQKERLKTSNKQTATKILDGIRKLYSETSSSRRWVWELLQNANDVATTLESKNDPQKKVKAEIILDKNCVQFNHNGEPFSNTDITHLIEQVSSKDRSDKSILENALRTTGKFGTGFMTTHLLSKKVNLETLLYDREQDIYKKIEVFLDRSPSTLEGMIEAVNNSFQFVDDLDSPDRCPLVEYEPQQDWTTEFTYQLDEYGLSVAEKGIDDLHRSICYTLVFLPSIESVTVNNRIETTVTSYKIVNREEINKNFQIYQIEKTISYQKSEIIYIASLQDSNQVRIAVELKQNEDKFYSIIQKNQEIPTLSCDFPLVGSETKFQYPVVVNSPNFDPTEPRDGILLDEREETGGLNNRKIIKATIPLYQQLLEYAASHWQDSHLLVQLGKVENAGEGGSQWYTSIIQNSIRNIVLSSSVVCTTQNETIELKEARIPFCDESKLSQFWNLASKLHPEQLPKESHLKDWYQILQEDGWGEEIENIQYKLEDFLDDISEQKNVKSLAERLGSPEYETIEWLNQVIQFMNNCDRLELISKDYKILPNQNGEFCGKRQLYKDQNIPEPLLHILKLLGEDWREELLHKQIQCNLLKKRNTKKVSEKINDRLENPKTSKASKDDLTKAVHELLSCIPDSKICTKPLTPKRLEKIEALKTSRKEVFEYCRAISSYTDLLNEKPLSDWTEDLWEVGDGKMIDKIAEKVSNRKDISTLSKLLSLEEEATIAWHDRFLIFINNHDPSILTKYPLIPNQNKSFQKLKYLKKDGGISETYKEVFRLLNIRELNDELLLKELNESKSLIDDEYTATPEDIAREIDDVIQEHSGDKRDNDFRQVVNLLDELVSQNEEWFKKYFHYFYDRRTELFVQAIGDESERRNVLDIVQAKDNSKLEVLAKIAKKPEEVTSEEIEKLGLDLSSLVNSQKNAQSENAGNEGRPDLGDDELSSDSSFVKDDDSVSDKESAVQYGKLGEEWATKFYEKYGYQVDKQDSAGYDFLCENPEGKLKVEVKAITYNRPNIRLTQNEWKKAIEYGNDYELFICSHDRGSKKHFIRVKKLWSTLQSRLAKLHTKRKTSVSYGSNEIESLVGFQQNENGQRNDIVLNWHRLFRDSNLEDIETYIYDESTSTFKPLKMDY